MSGRWQIEMFGGLRVVHAKRVLTRFRSRKAAALLAYLAFYSHGPHPRELLTEILWPNDDPSKARTRLRIALSSLRRQLEPPGVPAGGVIIADRLSVQLNPSVFETDVARFEECIRSAARANSDTERIQWLVQAVGQHRGPLLPCFFEEWVVPEQQRLTRLLVQALRQLSSLSEKEGDLQRAIEFGVRAITADPSLEETHAELIRLYAATGQPSAALRQYRELEQRLRQEFDGTPSATTHRLVLEIERRAQVSPARDTKVENDIVPDEPQREGETTYRAPPGPPPPVSVSRESHLPLQFTRFFGRAEDVARLHHWLLAPEIRLVTVTGPGGSGKTRLAIEAARQLSEVRNVALGFVSLTDLADPRMIPSAVRDALHLPRLPRTEPLEQVVEALSQQTSLLVLDDWEIVEGGASIVRTLLERLPDLTLLATSRHGLGLEGEREYPLEPLPTPEPPWERSGVGSGPPARSVAPLTLMQYPSVQLFVDRAQIVQPDFQVTRGNALAVAELCRRLEGIPLALELAAARIRLLTPAQMLEQLSHRFDFLVSRRRDVPARHQTMRAAIDWSLRLLAPKLRRLLSQLSVFRGGWTLAAATEVCGVSDLTASLGRLQDSSLIATDTVGETSRYRMLETLREYAAEQLTPEEQAISSSRHAHYFLAMAQHGTLDELETDHDNLRAALDWAVRTGEAELGLCLARAVADLWSARGFAEEGLERLSRLLALPQAAERTTSRARALSAAGSLATREGAYPLAHQYLEESLAIYREQEGRKGMGEVLLRLGNLAAGQTDYPAAQAFYGESITLNREIGDDETADGVQINLGTVLLAQGRCDEARALYEDSLAAARRNGDPQIVIVGLVNLGNVHRARGDYLSAQTLYEEGLTLARQAGDGYNAAFALHNLGVVQLRQGDTTAARRLVAESLTLTRSLGHLLNTAEFMTTLGEVSYAQGQPTHAARLFASAQAVSEMLGARLRPVDRGEFEQCTAAVRAELGDAAYAAASVRGRVTPPDQVIDEALAVDAEADHSAS